MTGLLHRMRRKSELGGYSERTRLTTSEVINEGGRPSKATMHERMDESLQCENDGGKVSDERGGRYRICVCRQGAMLDEAQSHWAATLDGPTLRGGSVGKFTSGPLAILPGLQIEDIGSNEESLLPLTPRDLAPHDNTPILTAGVLALSGSRRKCATFRTLDTYVVTIGPHRVVSPSVLDGGELGGQAIVLSFPVEMEEGGVARDKNGLVENGGNVALVQLHAFNQNVVHEVVKEQRRQSGLQSFRGEREAMQCAHATDEVSDEN